MVEKKVSKALKDRLVAQWLACRITSGRKSAQYGLRLSYPLYIGLVVLGIVLTNSYILTFTAFISLLGAFLPMHPFDYVYNYSIAKISGLEKIPGRGNEMQISSIMALVFNLGVLISIMLGLKINYIIMALIYTFISIFFVVTLLKTDDFSFYSMYRMFFKRK